MKELVKLSIGDSEDLSMDFSELLGFDHLSQQLVSNQDRNICIDQLGHILNKVGEPMTNKLIS